MISSEKISGKTVETAQLTLGNGWKGRALLSGAYSRNFSKTDWIHCLSQPQLLFEDVEEVLKTEGRNCVAVKNLTIGDNQLKVVIKRYHHGAGLRQFLRSFQPGRALRNFKTALKLLSCGIAVTAPLAALQQRRNLLTKQSIYITEYFENSPNLYNFASKHQTGQAKQFAIKKQLCHQLATILAMLHKNGLWHRDAKASNFIVTSGHGARGTGHGYRILLVDMDGIKRYFLRRRSRQFRSLWRLAASTLPLSAVNRTDYLRTFTTYCNLTGLGLSRRRRTFCELASHAQAKRRQPMAKAAEKKTIMPEAFKNILIIKPSSLGDIVLALPALTALRKSFPDANISWLVRPEFAPLLKDHPNLTDIILFDRKFLGKAWFHPYAFASLLSLILKLRRSKFDAVIDLQGLFRTASLAWLSGCKKRLGMANARELAHVFYTYKVSQNQECINMVDYYLKIIQATGASDIDVQFILPADLTAVDSAKRLLMGHGIAPNNYAAFAPGSTHRDKCWPIERFADLADKISSQFHLSIIATGTVPEKGAVEKLKAVANVPIANLAGRTSLGELIALLKAARLVVSNDTGPGHIAAALGTPLVLIFGRSNPVRVAPYGRNNCVVAIEPDRRGLNLNSTDPKHDIKLITVDEVYQKVCEQIRES